MKAEACPTPVVDLLTTYAAIRRKGASHAVDARLVTSPAGGRCRAPGAGRRRIITSHAQGPADSPCSQFSDHPPPVASSPRTFNPSLGTAPPTWRSCSSPTTGSTPGWAIALVLLADFLPGIVLAAPFGALADRLPRRRLAVGADILRAGAFIALAVIPSFAATVGLALLAGVGTALFRPAVNAALPGTGHRRAALAGDRASRDRHQHRSHGRTGPHRVGSCWSAPQR